MILVAVVLALVSAPVTARVTAVAVLEAAHDGDTLTIVTADRRVCGARRCHVRVAGVDAPEMASARWPEQPWAREARAAALALCPPGRHGRDLLLRFPLDARGRCAVDTPRYQRCVASVTCGVEWERGVASGGRDLAHMLVRNGHAWAVPSSALVWTEEEGLRDAMRGARRTRRGLWSQRNPVPPREWRRR